jgi:DNA-binding winged helix-turn-helix (wHTH) protein
VECRRGRCWSFADCAFDEANWTLTVAGNRVSIERKPLELLHQLLLHAGNLVSKGELLDSIWPDLAVVEASLPTAVRKLRLALGDDHRDPPIIETVPRIGYRLASPVEVEEFAHEQRPLITVVPAPTPDSMSAGTTVAMSGRARAADHVKLLSVGGGLAIAAVMAAMALPTQQRVTAKMPPAHFSKWEVMTALRRMDLEKIERMLAVGWNPATELDVDRNGALNLLLNNCEWDRAHDQRRMLLVARTLIDGGEKLDRRNAWGDTPYSIAKAERYCGPNHPVTRMINTLCNAGLNPLGDRCLADYKRSERALAAARQAKPDSNGVPDKPAA